MRRLGAGLAALGLAALGLTAMAAGVALAAAPDGSRLPRLFRFETLGTRLAFLESITGPAMHAFPVDGRQTRLEMRDYDVDGCRVVAWLGNGTVQALGMDLSPRCAFDLEPFFGKGYGSTAGLTVGRFARGPFGATAIKVQSECIAMCGNAAEPEVDFTWDGGHVTSFVGAQLTTVLSGKPSLDALDRWRTAMRREGADYVQSVRFNCDRKYDGEAVRDFAAVPVHSVVVGFELPSVRHDKACGRR